jgi:predicted  nucleic acid-binding Zn-ribbon protein
VILTAAEKEHLESQARAARQLEAMDQKVATLTQDLAKQEAERKELAAPVDEELLNLYDRLFFKKEGMAIAALVGEVCQGCHMKVTVHSIHEVRAERHVTHCVQCGRILYLER